MITDQQDQEKSWGSIDLRTATADDRRVLGERVRDLRKQRGLGQEDLSKQAGVSRKTIGNIERGEVAGQAETLSKILQALGIDMHATGYSDFTEQQVSIIASLMEALPEHKRAAVATEILQVLANALRDASKPDQ